MKLPQQQQEKPLSFTTKTIKSVGDDCLIFHCVAKFKDRYMINRNMIVLKTPATTEGDSSTLTLVNPLLLTAAGERALLKQGTVTNIVRLGAATTTTTGGVGMYDGAAVEDKYYLSKFPHCQRWAPGKLAACPNLPVHRLLKNKLKGASFHPTCRCFVLRSTLNPEAVLLLERAQGGNILIAGDCLQHQVDNPFVNVPTLARLKMAGLLKSSVVVSQHWLSANNSPAKGGHDGIQKSLETMTRAKFHRFISTSGNFMLKHCDTKQNVVDAVQKAFTTTTITTDASAAVGRERRTQSLLVATH